ncbi:MAG: sulfite exporter TauE/SafE family protein [Lachnospiraceae bacterium]|nr:sulfite exporter TauE/SafE family protein [Lachnospiraceae bacterium]
MQFFCFLICFGASIVGAICGIGGGVIIKPVLDALNLYEVSVISFLSGCTVLSMSTYSMIKSKNSKDSTIDHKTTLPLAIGAAIGGILGKWIFSIMISGCSDKNRVGAIQAACLLVITIGTLIYTIKKDKVKTIKVEKAYACVCIGLVLGVMSSFLGIGGGPINLVVLYFFFSMKTKQAAENSLYIIFFSQLASLCYSIVTMSIPKFSGWVLALMVLGGIGGGIYGRAFNKKLKDTTVDKLFIGLMILIVLINVYNIYRFGGI